MNPANVISVNPSRKTLGEICVNSEKLRGISRAIAGTPTISHTECSKRNRASQFINFIFGINSSTNSKVSTKLTIVRLICGAALLFTYGTAFLAGDDSISTLALCIAGSSIVLGLFTRISSTLALGWLAYTFALSVQTQAPDISYMLPALVCGIFTILGPGKFSFDQLMRYALRKLFKVNNKQSASSHVKPAANMSYRAYSMADRYAG